MKNLRRVSQILFLALFFFLFIQTEYKGSDELGLPVKFFLDFSPLISISTILATHAIRAAFLLSLITIVLSVLPVAFAVMIVVSLLTPRRVPPGVARIMVRLHTPETVDLDRGDWRPRRA